MIIPEKISDDNIMLRIGIILLAFGILYFIKPNLYKRWIWKETSILQRVLTPVQYLVFMRIMGVAFILIGTLLIVLSRQ